MKIICAHPENQSCLNCLSSNETKTSSIGYQFWNGYMFWRLDSDNTKGEFPDWMKAVKS